MNEVFLECFPHSGTHKSHISQVFCGCGSALEFPFSTHLNCSLARPSPHTDQSVIRASSQAGIRLLVSDRCLFFGVFMTQTWLLTQPLLFSSFCASHDGKPNLAKEESAAALLPRGLPGEEHAWWWWGSAAFLDKPAKLCNCVVIVIHCRFKVDRLSQHSCIM